MTDKFKQAHDQYLEVPNEEVIEDEEELDAAAEAELEELQLSREE